MSDAMPVLRFDARSPEFVRDPYPFYARLREAGPVHHVAEMGAYWVVSYSGVVASLTSKSMMKQPPEDMRPAPAPAPELPPQYEHLKPYQERLVASMLFLDPPAHTRLRSLVTRAFTPRVVEAMRPRIEALADELLAAAARDGGMDLVADFAFPLPATVIAELLGVPREDRDRFRAWSNRIAAALDAYAPPEDRASAYLADLELAQYFDDLIRSRRGTPSEDLIAELVAAEEEGDRLTLPEVLAMCTLLLAAGHETTTNLIGTGTYHLLRHREQLALPLADPDLWPTAVNELLRYDSPVQRTHRVLHEDVEVEGHVLKRGESVVPVLGAANRDPAVFRDPDELDLARRDNRHLAFGRGIHYCLGSSLAVLEASIAFRSLFERFPGLRLADGEPRGKRNTVVRGLASLPVLV